MENTMSSYKIRIPRPVSHKIRESRTDPGIYRDCTAVSPVIKPAISPNPQYQTRDYYLRREYFRRRKQRRRRRNYTIAASLAFCLLITAGILLSMVIGNQQSAIDLDDLTTTVYDEQIHVVDYVIENAFYCAACIDEPEISVNEKTPERNDSEDEQGENDECIICNREERIIIV